MELLLAAAVLGGLGAVAGALLSILPQREQKNEAADDMDAEMTDTI